MSGGLCFFVEWPSWTQFVRVFLAGIPLPRTWVSVSLQSVWWNACIHTLDLSSYSPPKERRVITLAAAQRSSYWHACVVAHLSNWQTKSELLCAVNLSQSPTKSAMVLLTGDNDDNITMLEVVTVSDLLDHVPWAWFLTPRLFKVMSNTFAYIIRLRKKTEYAAFVLLLLLLLL